MNKLTYQKIRSLFFIVISLFVAILILKEIHFFSFMITFILALKPLWIGIIISFFMQPFISDHFLKPRFIRVFAIYMIFMVFLLFFAIMLIYLFVMNLPAIIQFIQISYPKIIIFLKQYQLTNYFDFEFMNILLVNSYELFIPMIKNVLSFFSTFAFAFMIAFFISLENHMIMNRFKSYIKEYEKYLRIYDIFSNILKEYIISTLFDFVYIILTTSCILFFFKTPYAIILAFLLAFLNLFPYIGALIGNSILIVIHFMIIKENTLLLFIILFINSQIESNIVHTWICHKTMKIHPLFLFIGILINEYFFGIIGIILSPILAGMIQLAIMTYSEYLNQKNIGGWEKILP
ncbi:MAG: AI-2E family transporter [Traorella sp.]